MFCVDYYKHQPFIKDAEQFKITFNPADRTITDFLDEYKDKSIVIYLSSAISYDLNVLKELYKQHSNIKLLFDLNNQDRQEIMSCGVPYFFTECATSIDILHGLIQYHPTDIYVCEELGFHLDKVSKLLHDNNIKVRVFPNVCQAGFDNIDSLKAFWIRPEDIPVYEKFVDVFEIVSDKNHQETLYKIYKSHKWFGKIKDLIPNFKNDLDSKYLLDTFGMIRSKCGKRCFYKPESCKVCECFSDMAQTLKNSNIVVTRKSNL